MAADDVAFSPAATQQPRRQPEAGSEAKRALVIEAGVSENVPRSDHSRLIPLDLRAQFGENRGG